MSSRLSILAVFALTGCDVVFGLSGEPSPCSLQSFDAVDPMTITDADEFSFTPDGFGVVDVASFDFELDLNQAELPMVSITLEPQAAQKQSFGIVPEGDLVFFSAVFEPHQLTGFVRVDGKWERDAREVPKGTYAGGASSLLFGPRRVLVRLYDDARPDVQEYEDTGLAWVPVGKPFAIHDANSAPSLTENGLTLVMRDFDADNRTIIVAANRDSLDDAFPVGDDGFVRTTTLLSADSTQFPHSPQLFGRKVCNELRVASAGKLMRYLR